LLDEEFQERRLHFLTTDESELAEVEETVLKDSVRKAFCPARSQCSLRKNKLVLKDVSEEEGTDVVRKAFCQARNQCSLKKKNLS